MKAYVTNQTSALGASLCGALRWEGHTLVTSISAADVVFDTGGGVVYRKDRGLARFVFGELIGPTGEIDETEAGAWLAAYLRNERVPRGDRGIHITDARDVAVAMIYAAERGLSGEFEVVGPFVTFDELADMLTGCPQSRTGIALPEVGVTFRPVEETIWDVVRNQESLAHTLVA